MTVRNLFLQLLDLATVALLVVLTVLIVLVVSTAARKAHGAERGSEATRAVRPGEVRGDFWSYIEARATRDGADAHAWVDYPED
jgi:hypothetical protein